VAVVSASLLLAELLEQASFWFFKRWVILEFWFRKIHTHRQLLHLLANINLVTNHIVNITKELIFFYSMPTLTWLF
jgi:hypothetical protein